MTDYVYGLIYSITLVFVCFQICNTFCEKRHIRSIVKKLIIIVWCLVLSLISEVIIVFPIKLVLVILLSIMNMILIYDDLKKSVAFSVIIEGISIGCDFMFYSVSTLFVPNVNTTNVFSYTISYFI